MKAARIARRRTAHGRRHRTIGLGVITLLAVMGGCLPPLAAAAPLTSVDLSNYVRTGRFDLPTTPAPLGSLLTSEASSVTFDPDTNSLFVVGDGGTSVVQVSKTGTLIDSMTLGRDSGGAPLFADTEGITYVGAGRFVLTEERLRQVDIFTYNPGATLTRADVQTVKLGTTVGNIGIEGITDDPLTGDFIAVKETGPEGIFQTGIDFAAGTATNGSPTTDNSTNLFDPALAGLSDFSDVFALSNLTGLTGPDADNLLMISQESGKVINIGRDGVVSSALTIHGDLDNPLSVPDQTMEGVTMDDDGNLYVVNEQGGGPGAHPQLWSYAPSAVPNQAPTAITLSNQVSSIIENTSTATRLKVADVNVADDGLGNNNLTVTGPDAASFEVDANGLYIKAGTVLDFETKTSYSVSVVVDDPAVGASPDATSAAFNLAVTDTDETPVLPPLVITEVAPWGSGTTTYAADWFELTNTGTSAVDLTGIKVDDDSNDPNAAGPLAGVTSIPAGQSAIFLEATAAQAAAKTTAFKTSWFGSNLPIGFQIGTYTGSGGLSTSTDAVNLFTATGNRITGVRFGASTTGVSFDNAAGAGSTTLPLPTVSTLSVAGLNGAFVAGGETGSPGTIVQVPIISEVSSWGSGNGTYGSDWFEVTNTGTRAIDISGWKMDDNSNLFANSTPLTGVTSIPAGTSAIFLEDPTKAAAFRTSWFGAVPFPELQVGGYAGGGVGLSTSGDAVNLFDALGNRVTGIGFGASTNLVTFDNAAGLGSKTLPLPAVTTLSVVGVKGAYRASGETGSPGTITPDTTTPTVTYTGNAGTYTVDQQVAITCTAADEPRGSGLASTTCANVTGAAVDFGLGAHPFSASATDNANNVGTGSGSFTVVVTTASLCNLTRAYVVGSARYLAMKANQKAPVDKRLDTLCTDALAPIAGSTPQKKNALISRYKDGVAGLVTDGLLTQAQAAKLNAFASAL